MKKLLITMTVLMTLLFTSCHKEENVMPKDDNEILTNLDTPKNSFKDTEDGGGSITYCDNWQFTDANVKTPWTSSKTPAEFFGGSGGHVYCWHYAQIRAYQKKYSSCNKFQNSNPETGLDANYEMDNRYFYKSNAYNSRSDFENAISTQDVTDGIILGFGTDGHHHVAVLETRTTVSHRNYGSGLHNSNTVTQLLNYYKDVKPYYIFSAKELNFFSQPQIVKDDQGTYPKINFGGIRGNDYINVYKKVGASGTYQFHKKIYTYNYTDGYEKNTNSVLAIRKVYYKYIAKKGTKSSPYSQEASFNVLGKGGISVRINGSSHVWYPPKGEPYVTKTWTSTVSGGNGNYTYKWYKKIGNNPYYLVSQNTSYSKTYGYQGATQYHEVTLVLQVTDTGGKDGENTKFVIEEAADEGGRGHY